MFLPHLNTTPPPTTEGESRPKPGYFEVPCNIGAAADETVPKFALGSVHVQPNVRNGGVILAATDSRCMAVAAVNGSVSKAVLLPLVAFPKPTFGERRWPVHETVDGDWGYISEEPHKPNEGRFPRYADVLPSVMGRRQVRIDATSIFKLANALSDPSEDRKTITLLLSEHDHVIGVIGAHGIGAVVELPRDDNETDEERLVRYEMLRKDCQDSCRYDMRKVC